MELLGIFAASAIFAIIVIILVIKVKGSSPIIIITGDPDCGKTRLFHYLRDGEIPKTVKSVEAQHFSRPCIWSQKKAVTVHDFPSDQRVWPENAQELIRQATTILYATRLSVPHDTASKLMGLEDTPVTVLLPPGTSADDLTAALTERVRFEAGESEADADDVPTFSTLQVDLKQDSFDVRALMKVLLRE
eukprot:gnl/Dysnectes_brevis/2274_a2667_2038.p1 GENE.gnl/Dysnectes_brevis/2274_a2667_2038~~gnl/Dysnectes_brevis/2274_a2667_2038.p1  ORF type:complete len:213 (+),score=47.73 gnl/Dysnectes_brevis/2274_a2667_2038:72-641(+)